MVLPVLLLFSEGLLTGEPTIEVKEVVATCMPPDNGAGPLWCYGAPLLVRQGDVVYASVMETGQGVPPLSNTRWRLFRRDNEGWKVVEEPSGFRHREPCPLVNLGGDRIALSVNPSLEPPGAKYGRCDPHLLLFDTHRIGHGEKPVALRFPWPKTAHFTDHSYRGIAADSQRGEILALNIDATTSAQHWAFGTSTGGFSRSGAISFPIRACYPEVALRNRAAHVMAIGDVVEPREEWRKFKKQKTGRDWDYVFRRLFYTWTADLSTNDFATPIEIDSVDSTGGHITNLDLWIDPRGAGHLLYLKTNLSNVLRDHYFPGQTIKTTLEHVVVAGGNVTRREELVAGGESSSETPLYARFHAPEAGILWVVELVGGRRTDGTSFVEHRFFPIPSGHESISPIRLALKTPLTTFFTAAERGGNRPSHMLDLFGIASDGNALRYARVRLK
jgi:hypothetical protein